MRWLVLVLVLAAGCIQRAEPPVECRVDEIAVDGRCLVVCDVHACPEGFVCVEFDEASACVELEADRPTDDDPRCFPGPCGDAASYR